MPNSSLVEGLGQATDGAWSDPQGLHFLKKALVSLVFVGHQGCRLFTVQLVGNQKNTDHFKDLIENE